MGVTYKLKQDVIDFIVARKKADPSLSCRRLVDIVKDAYTIEVSKSSVNAVIKQFDLSNPVGRRATFKPPKNFAIPKEKKSLLRANMAPLLEPEGASFAEPRAVTVPLPAEAPAAQPEPPALLVEERVSDQEEGEGVSVEQKGVVSPEKDKRSADDKAMSLLPDPAPKDRSLPEPEDPSSRLAMAREGVVQGNLWTQEPGMKGPFIGSAVLKAAFWDLQRHPVFGEAMAEAMVRGKAREDQANVQIKNSRYFDQIEWALILNSLGYNRLGEFQDERQAALRVLSGMGDAAGKEVMESLSFLKDSGLEARVRVEAVLTSLLARVAVLRYVTRGKKGLWIDPRFFFAQTEARALPGKCEPLFSVIEKTTDRLITNHRPFTLLNFPYSIDSQEFDGFLDVFERETDAIERVEFFDGRGVLLLDIDIVPQVPRGFIVGTFLKDADYQRLELAVLKNSRDFYDEATDERLRYSEGFFALSDGQRLRAILVQAEEIREKYCLVSNMKIETQALVREFNREARFIINHNDAILGDNIANIVGIDDEKQDKSSMFVPHGENLFPGPIWRHCQESFFPKEALGWSRDQVVDRVFLVPGCVHRLAQGTLFLIDPPKDHPYPGVLAQIVRNIEKKAIRDYSGRPVFFRIK